MNLVLTVFAPFFRMAVLLCTFFSCRRESFATGCVQPLSYQGEAAVTYPNSNNCSLWCDIDINDQTIRLFNNHLQTTEVSRNKRKLEKELRADDTDRAERAALTLADGLHENFKKRAAQAEHINQLISASPYPTLVCGDFNSLPSSYVYQTVKGEKLNDGFQTCGHGYMYTFRYFKHLLRIDYILHSPELNSTDYFSPILIIAIIIRW